MSYEPIDLFYTHLDIDPKGAGNRDRTDNILVGGQTLCQLSYTRRMNEPKFGYYGAAKGVRTLDILITGQALCQLSYSGGLSDRADSDR